MSHFISLPQILALAKEIKNFTSFILDGQLFDDVDKYLVC